jgi:hypothetical protein
MRLFKGKTRVKTVKTEKLETEAQPAPPIPQLPPPPTAPLTEEEQKLLDEWRQKWSQVLHENFALGVVGHTVAVPHKGEMLLFYNLQNVIENRGPNTIEKRFIGIAEDLSLKEVYLKYTATPQGVSIDSEIKPVDYKKLNVSPEAVARLIQQVIKYEVT